MADVDDARVVGAEAGVRAVLRLDLVYECFYKGVFYLLVYEEGIGGYASLTGIEQFAPYDALGGDAQVGVVIDDTGALSAQFECKGG